MLPNNELVENFIAQASRLLEKGAMKQDIEQGLKALLQQTLDKLDVVSRAEFDAQTAVLQRTREKIEQLEQQLEALSKAD